MEPVTTRRSAGTRTSTNTARLVDVSEQPDAGGSCPGTTASRPAKRVRVESVQKVTEESSVEFELPKAKKLRSKKVETNPAADADVEVAGRKVASKPKRVRKKKADAPPPDPADYAPRTACAWKLGAHVSSAGGVENAVQNAARIGADAFALFLKSQRKWSGPPIAPTAAAAFKARLAQFGYAREHVLPHGSYLINLGSPDVEKREKSYECFLDELRRCEQLGLLLYNFHPGSTVGAATPAESLAHIAACINRAHKETTEVVVVLENTAGAGNVLGSTFEELGEIIRQVEDKTRVGVCVDTCHAFAAGYDIRTEYGWNETITAFDKHVGLTHLRGIHLNDSLAGLGSKKDRHANVGLGEIGLPALARVCADPRTRGVPIVLETPSCEVDDVWTAELAVLRAASARAHSFEDAGAPLDAATATTADTDGAGFPRDVVARVRERVASAADALGSGAALLVTHAAFLRGIAGPARAAAEKGGKTKARARRGVVQSAAAAAKAFHHEAAVKGREVEDENGEESELTELEEDEKP